MICVTLFNKIQHKKARQERVYGTRIQAVKPGLVSISSLRSALALGLVLWCAGMGCLAHGMSMVSGAGTASGKSAGTASGKSKTSKSEMAMNAHSCCKARHRSLGEAKSKDVPATMTLPEETSEENANSCCPLTSGSYVTASRSQTEANSSATIAIRSREQSFVIQFSVNRAIPLRLPNREQTYLTCGVLLI